MTSEVQKPFSLFLSLTNKMLLGTKHNEPAGREQVKRTWLNLSCHDYSGKELS
jgi:hypothetical protein